MLVRLTDIQKTFGRAPVLKGVSLAVKQGDLVALIGPSGCGKSTLLRCINGLESMDHGLVEVGPYTLRGSDQSTAEEIFANSQKIRQIVGMVFQSFNLFPHLDVLHNLTIAPQVVRRIPKDQTVKLAEALLAKVGLSEHIHHFPHELSGGEQQRAAIARALAMNPKVLLYDEPTSALDPTLSDEVFRVMKQLDQEGMTQIVVTHEIRFARDFADKVVFLEAGQIVEMGPPESVFGNPQDSRTRRFLRHFL